MTGHQQIIAIRQQGLKPAAVFIEAGMQQVKPKSRFEDPEKALAFNLFPTVIIPPNEVGTRLDLRFLAGCRVHLHAPAMTDEVLSLADMVMNAGAKEIVVCCLDGSELMHFKNNEWRVHADSDA